MAVLGEGKAAELLATLPAETITAGLQQSHTAPRLTPVEQAPGKQHDNRNAVGRRQ